MSHGFLPDDQIETTRVLKLSLDPVRSGKTWLRHKETSQAGLIDLMIMKGTFTETEMAVELNKVFGNEALPVRLSRIQNHIDHLQFGTCPPHRVRCHGLRIIKGQDGRIKFDIT